MPTPRGELPFRRGRRPYEGWPEEEVTLENRRLNEGLGSLWERSEVTDCERHRFLSDIVGEPM